MTRSEQAVEIVFSRHPQLPLYSLQILAERQALRAEIEHDQAQLELLRVKETELRAGLVGELKHLHFNIEVAAHRIETRQWADGCAALDLDFEHVKQAEEALMDCIEDIKFTASQIEDSQHDLDNESLWQEAS